MSNLDPSILEMASAIKNDPIDIASYKQPVLQMTSQRLKIHATLRKNPIRKRIRLKKPRKKLVNEKVVRILREVTKCPMNQNG